MATQQDEETRGARLALLTGLVVAGGVAAAAFGRVFQGTGVTVRLVLVCEASLLLAALLERRHVLLATLVSTAAMLVAVGLLVFPDTLRWGVPTLSTLRAIGTALSAVGRETQVTAPPAPPDAPLLLAGITAVWTAAFACHSLATRARSPFLALAPQAALLAFAGMVVGDGARPLYVLLYLFGSLIVLFADALRRVGQWGTVSIWHGRKIAGLASGTTVRGAWRVAAGCLGVALFVPWLLPGFGSGSVLRLQNVGGDSVSLDPIVDIRPHLISNSDVTVFTVRATSPTYWQMLTLDTFDGRQWSSSDPQGSRGEPIQSGPVPDPLGTIALPPQDVLSITQHFVIANLGRLWLPTAAEPLTVTLPGSARYDPTSGALVVSGLTPPGFSYDINSRVVIPSPVELRAVANLTDGPSIYTELPSDIPSETRVLAAQWSAAAQSPYDKIMAIQQQLRGWTYDLHAQTPKGQNDLVYFLTRSHRGYCQQFAGAMAVLLRELGYPTRIAVGFLPGTPDPKVRGYRVRWSDAHAWVQVQFPGYGWLSFDPTPTRFTQNPSIAKYDNLPTSTGGETSQCATCPTVGDQSGGGNADFFHRRGTNPDFSDPGIGLLNTPLPLRPVVVAATPTDWKRLGILTLAALALLTLITVPLSRSTGRRLRLRRDGPPRLRVLAAYGVLLDSAADVGHGRRTAETIREYRRRIGVSVPFTNGDFDALSALADRAAYAEDGLSTDDGGRAAALCRAAVRDIRRSVPWWRNTLGRFAIRPQTQDRAAA